LAPRSGGGAHFIRFTKWRHWRGCVVVGRRRTRQR
jgi:hypothetical protein